MNKIQLDESWLSWNKLSAASPRLWYAARKGGQKHHHHRHSRQMMHPHLVNWNFWLVHLVPSDEMMRFQRFECSISEWHLRQQPNLHITYWIRISSRESGSFLRRIDVASVRHILQSKSSKALKQSHIPHTRGGPWLSLWWKRCCSTTANPQKCMDSMDSA